MFFEPISQNVEGITFCYGHIEYRLSVGGSGQYLNSSVHKSLKMIFPQYFLTIP